MSGAESSRRRDAKRQLEERTGLTRIEGDPPSPITKTEAFRNERKVRLAVRTALASVVRPLTGMLPVSQAFDVVEEELQALRVWFEGQVVKHMSKEDKKVFSQEWDAKVDEAKEKR